MWEWVESKDIVGNEGDARDKKPSNRLFSSGKRYASFSTEFLSMLQWATNVCSVYVLLWNTSRSLFLLLFFLLVLMCTLYTCTVVESTLYTHKRNAYSVHIRAKGLMDEAFFSFFFLFFFCCCDDENRWRCVCCMRLKSIHFALYMRTHVSYASDLTNDYYYYALGRGRHTVSLHEKKIVSRQALAESTFILAFCIQRKWICFKLMNMEMSRVYAFAYLRLGTQ